MKLKNILNGNKILQNNIKNLHIKIKSIKIDSREVKKGDIFVALTGRQYDGHTFCKQAFEQGAVAVIVEKPMDVSLPFIFVNDTREALAKMSANFYKNTHRKLKIIYLVGTNGKTTTSYIIKNILDKYGYKTAIIGTLGAIIDDKEFSIDLTTPDPIVLHKLFYQAYKRGIRYIILEASAHAIFLKKLTGIRAEIAIFTNISQDHLDFFNDMDTYTNTKLSIFNCKSTRLCIVNADDNNGHKLMSNNDCMTISYGINNPSDVFAVNIDTENCQTQFVINAFDEIANIVIPLIGHFNVYNTLAAIAATRWLAVPMTTIQQALYSMPEISGRFNIIKGDITVIIDYAHTPDGLENLIKAVKKLKGGKNIIVFGCGGDRDKLKRPLMGRIAGENCDFCIITSDNPRFENPMNIISQIEEGIMRVSQNYICIKNRTQAIEYAIKHACSNDKVIVAGKGAENYLDIKGTKKPYSDKEAVEKALRSYRS